MDNYVSFKDNPLPTKYHYQVDIYETYRNKIDSKVHTKIFSGNDLPEQRRLADKYYSEAELNIWKKNRDYLQFAGPANFIRGKNVCYLIIMYLVEVFDGESDYHPVRGESLEVMKESWKIEEHLFGRNNAANYQHIY